LSLGTYAQETVSIMVDDNGGTIFSGNVPGASIVPKGSSFQYKAPNGTAGITKVKICAKKNTAGLFKVSLDAKNAWTPPQADETEATTLVTLHVGGACFRGNATRIR